MRQNRKGQERRSMLPILIIFILVLGGAYTYFKYGDKIKDMYHSRDNTYIPNMPSNSAEYAVQTPQIKSMIPIQEENDWCKKQELTPGSSREDPVSIRILGWDSTNLCCVTEVQGYNCALHRNSTMRHCSTGMVGGEIAYSMVDGYFSNTSIYKQVELDYDKEPISNKPCSTIKYPREVI